MKLRCDHQTTEVRLRVFADGSTHYCHQCLRCGKQVGGPVVKATIRFYPKEFDENLRPKIGFFNEQV